MGLDFFFFFSARMENYNNNNDVSCEDNGTRNSRKERSAIVKFDVARPGRRALRPPACRSSAGRPLQVAVALEVKDGARGERSEAISCTRRLKLGCQPFIEDRP